MENNTNQTVNPIEISPQPFHIKLKGEITSQLHNLSKMAGAN